MMIEELVNLLYTRKINAFRSTHSFIGITHFWLELNVLTRDINPGC